jgi:hypothetical protein
MHWKEKELHLKADECWCRGGGKSQEHSNLPPSRCCKECGGMISKHGRGSGDFEKIQISNKKKGLKGLLKPLKGHKRSV